MSCKTARNDTVPGVTSYSALVGLLQNFFAILQAQIIDIQYKWTMRFFVALPQFIRLIIWKRILKNPFLMTILVNHDVVDGGPAARFIARLTSLIEQGYGL